jgi:hypothetical protein
VKPARAKINRKRKPLATAKLEMVSKEAFRRYYDLITRLIGNSPGVYALYDDNELYYVGKSIDLRTRVKQHLRDRHLASWTHFSLYLAKKEEHIHEIEALLIRIANPRGNRAKPKGKAAGSLYKELKAMVKQKQKQEIELLFGAKKSETEKAIVHKGKATLKGLVKTKATLYKTYKSKDYKAVLNANGLIRFTGKNYNSATAAAKAITHGPVNGLIFWNIEDMNGDWIKLGTFMARNHG